MMEMVYQRENGQVMLQVKMVQVQEEMVNLRKIGGSHLPVHLKIKDQLTLIEVREVKVVIINLGEPKRKLLKLKRNISGGIQEDGDLKV